MLVKKSLKIILDHVIYIYYLIYIKKDKITIFILIDFSNKVNAMTSFYAKKLGFQT